MFAWILLLAAQAAPSDPPQILNIELIPDGASKTGVYGGGSDGDPGESHLLNMLEVFSSNDYPQDALMTGAQGNVGVAVHVSPKGQPLGCRLVKTSGNKALDDVTCRLLMERGRYTPALRKGKPVSADMKQVVRWLLPATPFEDARLRMRMTFDAEGALVDCKREPAVESVQGAANCVDEAKWVADQLQAEERRSRIIVAESGFLVGGAGAASGIGEGPGEKMFWRLEQALTIDPAGKVASCRLTGAEEGSEIDRNACQYSYGERFEPLSAQASDRSTRNGVHYFAVYATPASDQ